VRDTERGITWAHYDCYAAIDRLAIAKEVEELMDTYRKEAEGLIEIF
jgi:hypothetical protein